MKYEHHNSQFTVSSCMLQCYMVYVHKCIPDIGGTTSMRSLGTCGTTLDVSWYPPQSGWWRPHIQLQYAYQTKSSNRLNGPIPFYKPNEQTKGIQRIEPAERRGVGLEQGLQLQNELSHPQSHGRALAAAAAEWCAPPIGNQAIYGRTAF